jgi:hypothetical protein
MLFFWRATTMRRVGGSKHPTHSSEKAPSWTELWCEHTDSGSVSQLVALIKKIGYVEPELERTVLAGQMKQVREAQIEWSAPKGLPRRGKKG